jgi:hypothetical protein
MREMTGIGLADLARQLNYGIDTNIALAARDMRPFFP